MVTKKKTTIMSSKIQTEISNAAKERKNMELLQEAMARQRAKERDNHHRYITIKNGLSNLKVFCKVDEKGSPLPSEERRILQIKNQLGIK